MENLSILLEIRLSLLVNEFRLKSVFAVSYNQYSMSFSGGDIAQES